MMFRFYDVIDGKLTCPSINNKVQGVWSRRKFNNGLTLVICRHKNDQADLYFDWDDGWDDESKSLRQKLVADLPSLSGALHGLCRRIISQFRGRDPHDPQWFANWDTRAQWSAFKFHDLPIDAAESIAKGLFTIFFSRLVERPPKLRLTDDSYLLLDGLYFDNQEWWYKFKMTSGVRECELPMRSERIPSRDDCKAEASAQGHDIQLQCSDSEYSCFLSECRDCARTILASKLLFVPSSEYCSVAYKIHLPKYRGFRNLSQMDF